MVEEKITFIITSVIYFPDKKLSYTDTRSAFTPEQRIVQTMETIKSIRSKLPLASIVLIEMGRQKNIDSSLINAVDKYIYNGNNLFVQWAAGSKYKGLGEAAGLLFASKKIEQINSDIFFKISGRYFLNDGFNINYWQGNHFFFIGGKVGFLLRINVEIVEFVGLSDVGTHKFPFALARDDGAAGMSLPE